MWYCELKVARLLANSLSLERLCKLANRKACQSWKENQIIRLADRMRKEGHS